MNNAFQLHHGIINVGDLPIPFDMVLNAAVLAVVLTFVFLKVSWKESILTSEEKLFSTNQSFSGKLFGFLILALLTVPGLVSNEAAKVSITPLILWVFLWIGVPVLGLLCRNASAPAAGSLDLRGAAWVTRTADPTVGIESPAQE